MALAGTEILDHLSGEARDWAALQMCTSRSGLKNAGLCHCCPWRPFCMWAKRLHSVSNKLHAPFCVHAFPVQIEANPHAGDRCCWVYVQKAVPKNTCSCRCILMAAAVHLGGKQPAVSGGEQPSPNFTNDKIQVGHFFMLLGDFPLSVTLQVSNLRFCLVMEVGCPIRVFICCSIQRQLCNTLDILFAMLSPLLHLSLESVFFLTTASISEQGLIRQRWEFVLVSL